VEGIGPKRKRDLIKHFGSLKKMRSATRDQLGEVLPSQVATDLYAALHT